MCGRRLEDPLPCLASLCHATVIQIICQGLVPHFFNPTLCLHAMRPGGLPAGRLGSRKSNNGCITCKIRKVKCDEQRPLCLRCRNTGRHCDGYSTEKAVVLVQSDHVSTIDMYEHIDPVEVHCFEFFIHRVVPGLTRIVDKQFWHQTVLQVSQAEPSLWNAIIAMSCLIRHPQFSDGPVLPGSAKTPVVNENHRKALKWYGKSMIGLNERIAHEKNTTGSPSPLVLISCVIYMCIECLQDNMLEAFALFDKAVGMVGGLVDEGEGSSSGETSLSTTLQSSTHLERTIRSLLRHEAASHGLPIPRPRSTLRPVTDRFEALSVAREELYAVISACQTFVFHHVNFIKDEQGKNWTASSELFQQQEQLQFNLLRWHARFIETTTNDSDSLTIPDPHADELSSVLLVGYYHYFIWLSTCLSNFETSFDNFVLHFQWIVDHASRAIEATATTTTTTTTPSEARPRPIFILETRVIPSLYFVAIKCRHPQIRRAALLLLRKGPASENIWKAEPMARVAEMSIGVEESGYLEDDASSHTYRPVPTDGVVPPPEHHRIYRQEIVAVTDSASRPAHNLILAGWRRDDHLQWSRTKHVVPIL